MGVIQISGIELYAYHGCLEEEAVIGGNYRVDVAIRTDFEKAATKDELAKTVNYVDVYDIVKEQMAMRSKLIEHVAKRIASALLKQLQRVQEAEVKVTKMNPPMNGNVESVTVIYAAQRKAGRK